MCDKCGCGSSSKHLCPISLGLGFGITCFLAIIIKALWIMWYGPTPMLAIGSEISAPFTVGGILLHAFWGLVKGFIFGLVLALIYDFFACCFRGRCRKKGVCGCSCCSKPNDPVVKPNDPIVR